MELSQMTALELSRNIRGKKICVSDSVESVFHQIRKKEKKIHAYLDLYEEDAYKRAEQVQKGIEQGIYTGPLAGVPIAVKDNICIRGKKTTCASGILENFIPTYQAEVIDRLEQAGMILIGKTNMDEFAMGSTTETSAFGVTANPWNTEHVPGGSSGGSCAAVAAGEAYMALGSDTGGSIRQPSAFCGVTGIKPTYGTVSRYGLVAYASSLDQIGPVGKNTEDCAALLQVIAGYDPKDSTSLRRELPKPGLTSGKDLKGMRFGVPEEYMAEGMEEGVRKVFLASPLTMYLGDIYTVAVNLCALPAISLPGGFDRKGLPVGFQMIGPCFGENTLIRSAAVFENARGKFPSAEKGGTEV